MVFRYHHAEISRSMFLLSAMICSLLCTALHPHTHSSPLRGSSPAPYGAKTAYVGGVPVSQARYGVTGKLIMPAYKSLPVTPYQLCIVTSFQHSTDFLRSPSNEYSDTNFLDFLSRCIHKVLIKMPWSKLDWDFIDLFRLWVSNSWPRHLILPMHLLRKSRKLLQAVFH